VLVKEGGREGGGSACDGDEEGSDTYWLQLGTRDGVLHAVPRREEGREGGR